MLDFCGEGLGFRVFSSKKQGPKRVKAPEHVYRMSGLEVVWLQDLKCTGEDEHKRTWHAFVPRTGQVFKFGSHTPCSLEYRKPLLFRVQ